LRRATPSVPRNKAGAEDCLERAMAAATPRGRAAWARRGLSVRAALHPDTQALLLHQLYLAHYDEGRFADALAVAVQAAELGVLSDVMHQDAARAMQALGDVDGAVQHLRSAVRLGPPSRRAFHWWTLGSVLFLAGRHAEAIAALERAARWGTTDKPLYQGHLALAKCHAGRTVRDLDAIIDRLEGCPAGQGYGRFVLGELAFQSERFDEARAYLEAFVTRTAKSRRAMRIALSGELEMARRTLAELEGTG
jgi:tetratricopeptide (TPR) repeat protein